MPKYTGPSVKLRLASLYVFLSVVATSAIHDFHPPRRTCTVEPGGFGADDSPAILNAFEKCRTGGTVVFKDATYYIEQVMNTTGLEDVHVELHGTLLWGTNIPYWRNNSLPLGYQNQTTAWVLGGSNLVFDGFGTGTFDGNGQIWYNFAHGTSNLAGRPINLMISETRDSVFQNIRFVQSQFWTMAISHGQNLVLQNIYVNNTSNNASSPTQNTDGVDTFYSDNILFRNWSITNGDDSISPKANSTNILIQDSTFYGGDGVAIGSIGQYPGRFEFIENVTAERVKCIGTTSAAYVKTWTGVQQNYPPNGGGGGLGYAKNIIFRDFELVNTTSAPAFITQCISYSGAQVQCDTSHFQISNVTWGPFTGSTLSAVRTELQCSAASPCPGIDLIGFQNLTGAPLSSNPYQCNNTVAPEGINCTGYVAAPAIY